MTESIKNKYSVEQIPFSATKEWLLKKHYAKRIPSISFAFGLYNHKKELQGVCTFGTPASPSLCVGVCGKKHRKNVIELNRLCVNDELGKNALSLFVAESLKKLPPKIVVSYADCGMHHHGYIYQALNFLYTGKTAERTDIGLGSTHSRHYDKSLDYKKDRKKRTSKHRYIFFTGNKKQKREMRKDLMYEIKPYPKGENKRYDASAKTHDNLKMF